MVPSTKAKCAKKIVMAMAYSSGLMVQNMKVNGFRIKQRAKVHSGMQREMCMMAISEMIKLTAMECTLM
jgi:hypothetical protein